MGEFSVKSVADEGNRLFWSLAMLLENVTYYLLLGYFIDYEGTVDMLC
jgi:hypothetical protein